MHRAVEDSLHGDCRPTTSICTRRTIDDTDTALEETLGAFGELIRQGKVRAIGCLQLAARRDLAQALDLADRGGLPPL